MEPQLKARIDNQKKFLKQQYLLPANKFSTYRLVMSN